MSKVNAVKLNSANVKYDNSVDTERVYDIEANANLNDGKVISMDAGVVKKDGVQVASFNVYGNHNMNYNMIGVEDIGEQCTILMNIGAFVSAVETEIESNPINI